MAEDFKSLQATMTEEEFAGFLRGIEFVCGIFPKAQELILENPSSDDVELRKVAEASNYITYIVRTTIKLNFDVFCLGYQDEIFFQTFVVIYFKLSFEDQRKPMKAFARSQKLIPNAPLSKIMQKRTSSAQISMLNAFNYIKGN
ncbi:MAG: hypothetical protein ABW041_00265 [Dehalococcoides mccartyi]